MKSRLQLVFWLDVVLLLSVCALETVPFTGLWLHEWLGLVFAAMVVVHLLLSWTWIASTSARLFAAQSSRTRINYLLNLCLFACMTAIVVSGVIISQEAIPAMFGRKLPGAETSVPWNFIHDRLSDAIVILAGLHLAINWDWSAAAARKLLGRLNAGAQ
jgi:cytochrome b